MSVGSESTDSEYVRADLNRVLSSAALAKSPQLQAMLAYVVNETLAGRGAQIKAFSIAVDVFGRDSSFDPATDSIVRVQAGRLRDALARYYETEAGANEIRIELPKGTYEPVFIRSRAAEVPARAEPSGGIVEAPVLGAASLVGLGVAAVLTSALVVLGYVLFGGRLIAWKRPSGRAAASGRRRSTLCCSPR